MLFYYRSFYTTQYILSSFCVISPFIFQSVNQRFNAVVPNPKLSTRYIRKLTIVTPSGAVFFNNSRTLYIAYFVFKLWLNLSISTCVVSKCSKSIFFHLLLLLKQILLVLQSEIYPGLFGLYLVKKFAFCLNYCINLHLFKFQKSKYTRTKNGCWILINNWVQLQKFS